MKINLFIYKALNGENTIEKQQVVSSGVMLSYVY